MGRSVSAIRVVSALGPSSVALVMRGTGGGGHRDVEAGLGAGVCGEGGLVGVGAGVGDSEAEYVSLPWQIRSVPNCRNGSKRQPTSLGGTAGPVLREDMKAPAAVGPVEACAWRPTRRRWRAFFERVMMS